MNLFGKKKPDAAPAPPPPAPKQDETKAAMGKINDVITSIGKREDHIKRKIEKELLSAAEFKKMKRDKDALSCLKRKKMLEKQLDQLEIQKTNLENSKMTIESMKMNKEVIEATKMASTAMTSQVKEMGGVEAVEETMDAVEDGLQDAHEINEAVSRQVDMPGLDMDDDELLAELEGYEEDKRADELADELSTVLPTALPSAPVSFPSAGTGKVEMSEEERELAELAQSMAM